MTDDRDVVAAGPGSAPDAFGGPESDDGADLAVLFGEEPLSRAAPVVGAGPAIASAAASSAGSSIAASATTVSTAAVIETSPVAGFEGDGLGLGPPDDGHAGVFGAEVSAGDPAAPGGAEDGLFGGLDESGGPGDVVTDPFGAPADDREDPSVIDDLFGAPAEETATDPFAPAAPAVPPTTGTEDVAADNAQHSGTESLPDLSSGPDLPDDPVSAEPTATDSTSNDHSTDDGGDDAGADITPAG